MNGSAHTARRHDGQLTWSEPQSLVRERAVGEGVLTGLNPGQQVIKIVNEELVGILGGQTRQIAFAKLSVEKP